MKPKLICGLLIVFFFILLFPSCDNSPNTKNIVLGKIRKVSELAVVKFTLNKTILARKQKKIFLFKLQDASFLAYSRVYIEAGIAIDEIDPNDVKIDKNDNSIRVLLPPVKIINFSYPIEEMKPDMNYTRDSFLNRIALDDLESFFREAEIEIRACINHMGIRQRAEEKTKLFMQKLLEKMGFDAVYIDFKPPTQTLVSYDPGDLEREPLEKGVLK